MERDKEKRISAFAGNGGAMGAVPAVRSVSGIATGLAAGRHVWTRIGDDVLPEGGVTQGLLRSATALQRSLRLRAPPRRCSEVHPPLLALLHHSRP